MRAFPQGPLVAWYGDDFTGAAATMEAMAFAGLSAAVFFEPPAPQMLARFPGLRGIGIAGTARAQTPQWMDRNLPEIFKSLKAIGAPLIQYKICSTLDSSPEIGSIGRAMDIARDALGTRFFPILPAAPAMGRYQAFGELYATAPGGVFRLDRHPVMSRHPVTPMDEANVARHLARQTSIPLANLSLDILHGGGAQQALDHWRSTGTVGVTLDAVSTADTAEVGQLIWEGRDDATLCIASQGLQYALVEYWRKQGILPSAAPPASAGEAGPIAVVSGSVSPTTQAQIEYAEAAGFCVISLAPAVLLEQPQAMIQKAVGEAVRRIGEGRDVLLCTARGPDDPTVAAFNAWLRTQSLPKTEISQRVGEHLGEILRQLIDRTGLRRAVISGGDTSGYAGRKLGVDALTALAPTIPGAGLYLAHSSVSAIDGLQLALKGGQMGTPDYFSWVKAGGGPRKA